MSFYLGNTARDECYLKEKLLFNEALKSNLPLWMVVYRMDQRWGKKILKVVFLI